MKTIKYFPLFLLVVLVSCEEKSNPVSSEVNYEYFYNSWTRSYEEETNNDSIKLFRPNDYKEFSISRYREILIFKQDNSCSYLVLAPNDAHYFQSGKWNLINQEKNIITIFDSTNTIYKNFQITELKQDILKLIIVD